MFQSQVSDLVFLRIHIWLSEDSISLHSTLNMHGSHFGHSCGDFHAGGGGLSYEVSRPAEEPPSTGTRYNPNTAIPPHVLMSSVSSPTEILQAQAQEQTSYGFPYPYYGGYGPQWSSPGWRWGGGSQWWPNTVG